MTSNTDFYAQFLITIDGWALRQELDGNLERPAEPAGMAVYANTGRRAAIEALESNFLSVANWLGGPWFWPVASAFAVAHPPRDGRLFLYGKGFPDFLASLEHESLNRYASDLAWVDWMYMQAHAAADHAPLTAARLAALPPEALFDLRIQVPPATQWRPAPDYPLVALWRNARTGLAETETVTHPHGGVLVTRPDDSVAVTEVSRGSLCLLDALSAGLTFAEAAAQASAEAGTGTNDEHILQEALGTLLEHGALSLPPEMAD